MTKWGSGFHTSGSETSMRDISPASTEQTSAESMPKAILAGLNLNTPKVQYNISMAELGELARACGLAVVETMVQNASEITHRTFIGSGKVDQLRQAIEMFDADIVIFNEALSPMQVRNLEDALDTEVLDRTGIILQIFSGRARTRESRLQVESARLQYMLPRLVGMRRSLSRQGGGSGRLSNKGAGEEQLELDRRHIEQRLEVLRGQLKVIETERSTQRSHRIRSGLPRICLVGYTNAGKSTLMNTLLRLYGEEGHPEKQVFEEDMLFATLDTTVRKISAPGHRSFLLSDTVGFIRDLPTSLVKAFHSTLEEAQYADLLLEIIDYSDPACEEHIRVTKQTLEEIGAGKIPVLFVCNKADRSPDVQPPQVHGERIYMSAKYGIGVDELLCMIDEALAAGHIETELVIPYSKGSLLHYLQEKYVPEETEYLPEGTKIRLTISQADLNYVQSNLSV